jgi:type I site-specific restriction-modification system R (restriction) subunit
MTGAASDPASWQQHIGGKRRRDALAKRARDPDDTLKLVLVRDMWLTGFDAPCMNTMYIASQCADMDSCRRLPASTACFATSLAG